MPSKPERTIPPTEELFGGDFRAKLYVEMYQLWGDRYAGRYTYHTSGHKNITTCSLIVSSNPKVKIGDKPRGLLVLGHFDTYANREASLECAAYTIDGEMPGELTFVPRKGNFEYFEDPSAITEVNSIFLLGSKQPAEPEEEYFKLLAEKLKAY